MTPAELSAAKTEIEQMLAYKGGPRTLARGAQIVEKISKLPKSESKFVSAKMKEVNGHAKRHGWAPNSGKPAASKPVEKPAAKEPPVEETKPKPTPKSEPKTANVGKTEQAAKSKATVGGEGQPMNRQQRRAAQRAAEKKKSGTASPKASGQSRRVNGDGNVAGRNNPKEPKPVVEKTGNTRKSTTTRAGRQNIPASAQPANKAAQPLKDALDKLRKNDQITKSEYQRAISGLGTPEGVEKAQTVINENSRNPAGTGTVKRQMAKGSGETATDAQKKQVQRATGTRGGGGRGRGRTATKGAAAGGGSETRIAGKRGNAPGLGGQATPKQILKAARNSTNGDVRKVMTQLDRGLLTESEAATRVGEINVKNRTSTGATTRTTTKPDAGKRGNAPGIGGRGDGKKLQTTVGKGSGKTTRTTTKPAADKPMTRLEAHEKIQDQLEAKAKANGEVYERKPFKYANPNGPATEKQLQAVERGDVKTRGGAGGGTKATGTKATTKKQAATKSTTGKTYRPPANPDAPVSDRQRYALKKAGIDVPEGMTAGEAHARLNPDSGTTPTKVGKTQTSKKPGATSTTKQGKGKPTKNLDAVKNLTVEPQDDGAFRFVDERPRADGTIRIVDADGNETFVRRGGEGGGKPPAAQNLAAQLEDDALRGGFRTLPEADARVVAKGILAGERPVTNTGFRIVPQQAAPGVVDEILASRGMLPAATGEATAGAGLRAGAPGLLKSAPTTLTDNLTKAAPKSNFMNRISAALGGGKGSLSSLGKLAPGAPGLGGLVIPGLVGLGVDMGARKLIENFDDTPQSDSYLGGLLKAVGPGVLGGAAAGSFGGPAASLGGAALGGLIGAGSYILGGGPKNDETIDQAIANIRSEASAAGTDPKLVGQIIGRLRLTGRRFERAGEWEKVKSAIDSAYGEAEGILGTPAYTNPFNVDVINQLSRSSNEQLMPLVQSMEGPYRGAALASLSATPMAMYAQGVQNSMDMAGGSLSGSLDPQQLANTAMGM